MMPRAPVAPSLPLQGLFPIAKPSGPTSMKVIDSITPLLIDSKLFHDPSRIRAVEGSKRKKNTTHMGLKIGQGGTLDPLADGVLVIGVNRGTKHLNQFLECTKEYESTGLLGAATTTFDSEGAILSTAPFDHITREDIEKVLDKFRGSITQVPPIFSALKMDGKPLYEYARESLPLPRAIPTRKCEVSIDLIDFTPASVSPGDGGHEFRWPKENLSQEDRKIFQRLTEMVHQASEKEATDEPAMPKIASEEVPEISAAGKRPPTFTVRMTVSSGTYVRSIVHDIGLALGCAAHVVTLRRTRQGQFSLFGDEKELLEGTNKAESSAAAVANGSSHLNGQSSAGASSSTAPAPVAATLTDEEAMNNTGPSTAAAGPEPMDEEEAMQNAEPVQLPAAPSSSSCIPWSVWENAIKERQEEIAKYDRLKREALDRGEPASGWTKDAIAAKRRLLPLREWEHEVLKRFVSVPLPYHGWHRDVNRNNQH